MASLISLRQLEANLLARKEVKSNPRLNSFGNNNRILNDIWLSGRVRPKLFLYWVQRYEGIPKFSNEYSHPCHGKDGGQSTSLPLSYLLMRQVVRGNAA